MIKSKEKIDVSDLNIKEKKYNYSNNDSLILNKLCSEINASLNENIHYLFELDEYYFPSAAEIILKYINLFETEEIKSYLIRQIANSKMNKYSKIILELYKHYQTSQEYLSTDYDVIFTIGCNYDYAFKKLKPKNIKYDLLNLTSNPRDAFNLSNTVKMMSSWEIPEMENVLKTYLHAKNFNNSDFCIFSNDKDSNDIVDFMKNSLIYLGLYGLRYYPSKENLKIVKNYLDWKHCFIDDVAKITYMKIKKHLNNLNNDQNSI